MPTITQCVHAFGRRCGKVDYPKCSEMLLFQVVGSVGFGKLKGDRYRTNCDKFARNAVRRTLRSK